MASVFSELKEDIILPETLSRVAKLYSDEGREIPPQALENNLLSISKEILDLFWSIKAALAKHFTLVTLEDKTEKLRKSSKEIFTKRPILIEEAEQNNNKV